MGEITPYHNNEKFIFKQLEYLFLSYFKDKFIESLNFIKIKQKLKSPLLRKLLPAFDQATKDIISKKKGLSFVNLISKDNYRNKIPLYASGGMLF